MRLLAVSLFIAACAPANAGEDTPPGIVVLRPAPDFALRPDAEIVIVIEADGRRNADSAQALAAQVANRVPDLVVVAAGRGAFDYGVARVEVRTHSVDVIHRRTGARVVVDVERMRTVDGTTVVRMRRDTVSADAFDFDGLPLLSR